MSDKNFEIIRQIASKLGVSSSESNDDIYNPLYLSSISRSVDRLFSQLQAAQAKIKELEQAQEWISVDDAEPEISGDYLVFSNGWVNESFYSETNGWDRDTVTHWMPLPPQPKGE